MKLHEIYKEIEKLKLEDLKLLHRFVEVEIKKQEAENEIR